MALLSAFENLKKKAAQNPEEKAKELNFPSGGEVGFSHPENSATVLCRDDGVVELSSGPSTNITVDPRTNQVTIKGAAISLQGEYLHLHAPAGRLYFGFQRFNPHWLDTSPIPNFNPASLILKSPVVFNSLSAVSTPVLTGTPAPGQVPVPLGAFFLPVPLFGPNEQLLILSKTISSLIKNVALPG